jgi:hypothetical protein
VSWGRGPAILTKWSAAFRLAAGCELDTGNASVAMLQGFGEALHYTWLQEVDRAGGHVAHFQVSAGLYVPCLRSELMSLAFARASTPLLGGCAEYATPGAH